MNKVAVIFHRFGPYHHARLAAAARRCDLLAIEEANETSEYAWDAVPEAVGCERVTLLNSGERPAHPAREISRRLRRLLDARRPEVLAIPGWSDPAALAALAWGLEHGVPSVLMSESTAFDDPRRAWKEWVKRRIVGLCAAGLVGGAPHADYLAALGMPRERILPGYDAVDNAHFATGAATARENSAVERVRLGLPDRYFLASSRFLPQKNLRFLLTAYAAYRRAELNVNQAPWGLVLLGDGPLRAALLAQRDALGLGDALLLPGFQQYTKLPTYYGLAGAFVHSAAREPWGLVVNEAMAAGLPVLVSDRCGCARDLVVVGENGYTFAPTDTSALARLLRCLAGNTPKMRAAMGARGRQIIAGFSPEVFGENLRRAVAAALACPPRERPPLTRPLLAALIRQADARARRLLPASTSSAPSA